LTRLKYLFQDEPEPLLDLDDARQVPDVGFEFEELAPNFPVTKQYKNKMK
jgi:hypothetical protein